MNRLNAIFGLAFLLFTTILHAQNRWEYFANSDFVNCVRNDEYSIFVGSANGLVVINKENLEFTVLNKSNSPLPTTKINCLEFDNTNTLWIGTDRGLVNYNTWQIFDTSNSLLKS
ncbi:MAG: two-component regulator propeller domain-containing protein, partial [bacterium]